MRREFDRSVSATFVTAILAGIAGVTGSYALAGYTQSFIAAPITSFVTQKAPGFVLQFAIGPLTSIGRPFGIEHLGQQANFVFALVLGGMLFACLALVALTVGRWANNVFVSVGLVGVLVWVAATAMTGAPMTALGAGIASSIVIAVAAFAAVGKTETSSISDGRRAIIGSVASALGVGIFGYVLGQGKTDETSRPSTLRGANATNESSRGDTSRSNVSNASTIKRQLADADAKSFDIDGLEGLVSGDDFYEVDIDNINPNVSLDDWNLSVTGAVENKQQFNYKDITSLRPTTRFKTLRCVSDPLNGHEMDNALWTGIPIKQIIDAAKPQGNFVMLRAADNYYEEFPVAALRTGMLAYGKDGNTLPQAHGYPIRALIPGHCGEINVKWLTEIEILDRSAKGFWEEKGWHGTGPVNTVAKLYTVNYLDNGQVQVAGHAYAGTRGIKRVEVSTDGGRSWKRAQLSKMLSPTLMGDVWRQWVYTYHPPNTKHEVIIRAIDGTGTLQPKKDRNPYPSGATGWVSKTINP